VNKAERRFVWERSTVESVSASASGDSWIEPYVREVGYRAFQFAAALLKNSDLSEDIVQEAFVRAWLSPHTPRVMPDFQRWLFRVIINLVRDHQRRETHWFGILPRLAAQASEAAPAAGNPAMRKALDSLSPREREAIYLRF